MEAEPLDIPEVYRENIHTYQVQPGYRNKSYKEIQKILNIDENQAILGEFRTGCDFTISVLDEELFETTKDTEDFQLLYLHIISKEDIPDFLICDKNKED